VKFYDIKISKFCTFCCLSVPINQVFHFRLRVHTLPLPIRYLGERNMMRGSDLPVVVKFQLDSRLNAAGLNCYSDVVKVEDSSQLASSAKTMFRQGHEFTLQWNRAFESRRQGINCTLFAEPGKEGSPARFYWHSFKIGDPNLPEK
jgi:hypothetical protein